MFRNISETPPAAPGFIGPEHTAVEVVSPSQLAATDPFVLLMDDRIDMPEARQMGGAHPHAGLETVTLVLEGELVDRDEGVLQAGDAVWMTAGSGIIHSEAIEAPKGKARFLQLWVGLSAETRHAPPRFEIIRGQSAPQFRAPGVKVTLYSGTSAGLTSATKNHVPITLVDIDLAAGKTFKQDLPASYNGFVYVIAGDARVGAQPIKESQVAWLEHQNLRGTKSLELVAGETGVRVVLYAGEPHRSPMIHHGPFVAGSRHELAQFFQNYQLGRFAKMSELAKHEAR